MSLSQRRHLVVMDEHAAAFRAHFLGWQCRIRQHAVRQAGGRPTAGMRPSVGLSAPDGRLGHITVLIVKPEAHDVTAQFRHIARKTHDPAERYAGALKVLAAAYYQDPEEFSDELTALFGPANPVAEHLVAAGECHLAFEQFAQRYELPCAVRELAEDHAAFQATYWHNALFNPNLPGGVRVLAFRPDWTAAAAEPPVY